MTLSTRTYPEKIIARATLYLHGSRIDPDTISRALAIQPSESVSAQEGLPTQVKSKSAPRWILRSDEHVASSDLAGHVEWLVSLLERQKVRCKDLPGVERAVIGCFWCSDGTATGFVFHPSLLTRVANTDLEMDFYIVS